MIAERSKEKQEYEQKVSETGKEMRFAKVDKKTHDVSKHYKFETKDYVDMNFSGFMFASSKVDRCVARIRSQ